MNQKRKIVLFIATSLDGYIATKNNSLDWLFDVEGDGDNGFSAFYQTVDTILMGRRTYDWIMNQELDSFPYEGKACYVFTQSVVNDTKYVKFINEDMTDFLDRLKSRSGKNIWIAGGGGLINSIIKTKQVDEIILTIAPTILGGGISLFREGDYHLNLELKQMKRYNQFAELYYMVKDV
ncbi:dihydrofolate reductase family protein [Amphibacillus sediminis]|uniref:dihydrofolate reductase family protein n=1 Tax=Amphibacillus sediminis TaxID=360185 RepID=UPI00082B87A8|nr:dihydrofolate reductase family protein [Amphibacillus sediminis]